MRIVRYKLVITTFIYLFFFLKLTLVCSRGLVLWKCTITKVLKWLLSNVCLCVVHIGLCVCVRERESLGISLSVFQKSMSPSQSSRWRTVRSQSHFAVHLPRLFGLVWRLFNRITDNSTCGDGAWTLFSYTWILILYMLWETDCIR